jgi:acetoin utilization protein AcuB
MRRPDSERSGCANPTSISRSRLHEVGAWSVQRLPIMRMPAVDRYMTREPYSVESTDTLARVRHMMVSHAIRHLPVIDGGRLVGVVSDRDLVAIERVPGVELARVEVARVMSSPVQVWGETPLDEVSELMTKKKADCVVVQGGHGVAGIFTAIDALTALTDILRRATA